MLKSKTQLVSFVKYCTKHPNERFWQALKNWSGFRCIRAQRRVLEVGEDTYYMEGRNA